MQIVTFHNNQGVGAGVGIDAGWEKSIRMKIDPHETDPTPERLQGRARIGPSNRYGALLIWLCFVSRTSSAVGHQSHSFC